MFAAEVAQITGAAIKPEEVDSWAHVVEQHGMPIVATIVFFICLSILVWLIFRWMKGDVQKQLDVMAQKIIILNSIDEKATKIREETAIFRENVKEILQTIKHDVETNRTKLENLDRCMDKQADTLMLMAKGLTDNNLATREMMDRIAPIKEGKKNANG